MWALLFVVVTVVGLERQAGLGPWHTIWAEDGSVFYQGTPNVGHLFEGYAGYLELVPRLIGLGAQPLALHHLAWYFAIAGGVVTTLCAAAVWRFSAQLVPSVVLRATLALSIWLLPAAVFEQLGNGVNTIWALTFAAWWAILYRPTSPRDAVWPAAVVFLAVASQAIALVYAPVAAYEVWRRRDRPAFLVVGAFVVATVLQLVVVMASSGQRGPAGPSSVGDLPELYTVRVLGSALVGEKAVGDMWDAWGVWFGVLAGLLVLGVVVLLVQLAGRGRRAIGLLWVAYGVGLWTVCVWGRGSDQLRIPAEGYNQIGARWTSLSIWLLLAGLFILAAAIRSRTVRSWVVSILALQFAVVAAIGFRSENPRSDSPTWTDSIRAAQALCATGEVDRATAVVTPPAIGFGIIIDCVRSP